MQQCSDNESDRKIGAYWERQFCKLAAERGVVFSPLQIDKAGSAAAYWKDGSEWNHFTLPDVTIWTAPGQHHEIKHKSPTKANSFGLEAYRFHALLAFANATQQAVLYTIHNHAMSGGRDATENHIEHWLTANIVTLNSKWTFVSRNGTSWVSGQKIENITIYYWPITLWQPLQDYWDNVYATRQRNLHLVGDARSTDPERRELDAVLHR